MNIEIIRRGDQLCPTVICDVCAKPITDGRDGMAKWDPDKPNEVTVCHKGQCDGSSLGGKRPLCYWHELDVFLIHLLGNTNVNYQAAKERAVTLAAM